MDKILIRGVVATEKRWKDHNSLNTSISIEGEGLECSDGYHTFKELYDHRITLFIALCRSMSDFSYYQCDVPDRLKLPVWRSKINGDGSAWELYFIMGVGKENGQQITYHIPIERWEETSFAETLDQAPEFDGHTSADVLERLKQL